MGLEFEWDLAKASWNAEKHGVTFDEVLTAFADPLARIFDDPDHSTDERREIVIGRSLRPRLIVVCFRARGQNPDHPCPQGYEPRAAGL